MFQLAPIAGAAAVLIGLSATQPVLAQQAFSAAWFANKGVVQNTAASTGYLPNGTPVSALMNPTQQQQQANAQLQQSISNLSILARGIAAQQAAQAAARQAALANGSSVPDGLTEGGLKVDTNSLTKGWINANAPTQSTANGKTTVAIQQTADKAILNWETFNVGKNTILSFAQDASWALLNRVNDPQARPSQIQGQINAPGTVMIANRNGVIFSGSSQIDTRNLVAAAANITDAQFRDKGIYGADANTASFTDANGKLLVEAGARITTSTPSSVTDGGGYVLLLGSEVNNVGTVSTERGQVQMAAGDSFIIRKGVASDANTWSTTRGNEISPQRVAGSTAGKVSNDGLIAATEGDITLAGHEVRQNGVALATTTVNTRGTIHLLNAASDTQGSVTLGTGSNTAVVIDDDGMTTALNSQRDALITASTAQDTLRASAVVGKFDNLAKLSDRRDQSRIEIVSGGNAVFEADSLSLATGGQIAVAAVGRSFVASGANIDVAGAVGVRLAMDSNNIKVNIQGNELRDAALARDGGKLTNSDVWVDTGRLLYVAPGTGGYESERWYTQGGLLEVGGYLANQGHRIGEWAAQGGTIMLGGKEVVAQSGSAINISGGSLDVQTGYRNISWVRRADGTLVSIDQATADESYQGVYKGFEVAHARWGDKVSEYFYNTLIAPQRVLQDGYTVGRDAGKLVINAPTAVLEGSIDAAVYNGPQQINAHTAATDGYKQGQGNAARAGALLLGQYGALGRSALFDSDVRVGDVAHIGDAMQADTALDASREGTVWLDAAWLNAQQLGRLDLGTRGAISVERALTLADGGQVTLTASSIDIGAGITARAGSVRATNLFTTESAARSTTALTQTGMSGIVLRSGATLDVRGVQPGQATGNNAQAYVNGGDVAIVSTHDVNVEAGSLIDVSGGAVLTPKGAAVGGRGGSVSLQADASGADIVGDGTLTLAGELRGYGVKGGGKLAIETHGEVVVGNGGDTTSVPAGTVVVESARLQSGFSTYDINGHGGLSVADGAQVEVLMPVYELTSDGRTVRMDLLTPPQQLADIAGGKLVQRQGADLLLRSQRLEQEGGDIRIGSGAVVSVDPGRSISLLGGGLSNIVVDGRLNAWGGDIAIGIDGPLASSPVSTSLNAHNRAIWIGENAVLDVAARAVTATDANGRRFGKVADGGSITIGGQNDWDASSMADAPDVAVVIRPGALLDASGANATFDLSDGVRTQVVDVASSGGNIVVKSRHSLYLDGTMLARAGGAGASGGTLAIALETPVFPAYMQPDDAVRTQREFIFSQANAGSGLAADLQFGQADPALRYGAGRFSSEQVAAGGFGSLSLLVNGLLSFDGDVNLSTSRSLALYAGAYNLSEAAAAGSNVHLASSYLRLAGSATDVADLQTMYSVNWRSGASKRTSEAGFSAEGDLVEIRDRAGFGGASGTIGQKDGTTISIDRRGFAAVDITSRGDVRLLSGTPARGLAGTVTTELASTGDLTVTAAQIYPVSGASAQLLAGYKDGDVLEIRRQAGAVPETPASVFGALALRGDTVRQGGIVRAPLGQLTIGQNSTFANAPTNLVELLPGSITSVSAAGLTMPYGGTVDGLIYSYDGSDVTFRALGTSQVSLIGDSVVGYSGAVLDLSGGGTLAGAGFVTGRGGSVDILRTPLVNANPSLSFSDAGNAVYAIVPSSTLAYAPILGDTGAGAPAIGQQVTLQQDAGGLKAGTYTLLPSTYTMLPGAFRVEVGGQVNLGNMTGAGAVNGTTVTSGYLGVANTSIRASLPNQLLVTPGTAVRQLASYNETGYDAFAIADAQRRGGMRGELAADAHSLSLNYSYSKQKAGKPLLSFKGDARFDRAEGGLGGSLDVQGFTIEVLADGMAPTNLGYISLYASDLNAFKPSRVILGGTLTLAHGDNLATFKAETTDLYVRSGATLAAPEVFLTTRSAFGAGAVVEQGASINTIGQGKAAYDTTDGVTFSAGQSSVLGLSNGWINMLSAQGNEGQISVGYCTLTPCAGATSLLAEGTLVAATNRAFAMADSAVYGARNLVLGVLSLNMGTDTALAQAAAAGQLPGGLAMNQGVLDRLLSGNTGTGVPAVESLVLNVKDAINMFGTVNLDVRAKATGKDALQRLVFSSPAIYGYGQAGDVASINVNEIVWTGSMPQLTGAASSEYGNLAPGAAIGGQLGSGTLALLAHRIILGYGPNTQPLSGASSDRLAVGFANVNLSAGEYIGGNGKGTLAVYQDQGAMVNGTYQYSGGNIHISTPLVRGEAGSSLALTAGSDIVLTGPVSSSRSDALGAELSLAGRDVTIDTRVALPSGRLAVNASRDITLTGNADIDLAGRDVQFYEQTRYSQGGKLVLVSSGGNITQAAASTIDVSARNNDAGSLQVTALETGAGHIDLAGTILGHASGSYDAGGTVVPREGADISVRGQTIADFTGLNARLDAGGAFAARRFQLKQGDLAIGDELKARVVELAVDGGSLTVNGKIDASGFQVGTIRLSARDNLNINGVLDAHARGLRVDSYGLPIDAANRAMVDLTATGGVINLASVARIDVRAADGVARGTVDLNAPRLGNTDVAVNVAGSPTINGARTVAVNAFRRYDDVPLAASTDVNGRTSQLISQVYLDQIDLDSQAYMSTALGNVTTRLAGLGSFHLRPGVEIVSNAATNPSGDLTVLGDLDLSGYRYGPDANRIDAARRGFGEPGVLVLRASGDLNIYGSINDGFAPPPATPNDTGWYLSEVTASGTPAQQFGSDIVVPIDGVVLEAGSTFARLRALNYDIPIKAMQMPSGTLLPADATLTGAYTIAAGTVLGGTIYNANGSVAAAAGTVTSAAMNLTAGMRLGAGTRLTSDANLDAMVWPKGAVAPVALVSSASITLKRGALIPAGSNLQLPGDEPIDLRPEVAGVQGRNWAQAAMLPQGTTSWDMQLTAGADLAASDRRATTPDARGSIILSDAHTMYTMTQVDSGTGLVWTEAGKTYGVPGTAVPTSRAVLCRTRPTLCTTDPIRISYTYTAAGSVAAGNGAQAGQTVPANALAAGFCAITGNCNQVIGPIPKITNITEYSPLFSVLRTGAADLILGASRDIMLMSPYGIYTAGTPSSPLLDAAGVDRFQLARGLTNGSVTGLSDTSVAAALAGYQAWYPELGGNLTVNAGRDIGGNVWGEAFSTKRNQITSAAVGNWLWRQGSGTIGGDDAISTAWWINFGSYVANPLIGTSTDQPYVAGFTGLGTLGGGNLSITAGRDAGVTDASRPASSTSRSGALVAAVGSTGRVGADGSMVITGGGDLTLQVGGTLNPAFAQLQTGSGGTSGQTASLNGVLTNLRGTTSVDAGAIGNVQLSYRNGLRATPGISGSGGEVRPIDPFKSSVAVSGSGVVLMPGDSAVYIDTLRDLVVNNVADPGRVDIVNTTPYSAAGVSYTGGGQSWFSLWTGDTALNLFTAGGNLTPGMQAARNITGAIDNVNNGDSVTVYPSILRATAASGSIFYGYGAAPDTGYTTTSGLLLAPSAGGALEMLAADSIYGGTYNISMSNADVALPTPMNPAFASISERADSTNVSRDGGVNKGSLFAFGADTPYNRALHEGDHAAALFYAVKGDIVGLSTGRIDTYTYNPATNRSILTWYRSALPARILAGGDIVGTKGVFMHNNIDDISLVQAGRDIIYADLKVIGSGTLELNAGRNIRQDDRASLVSLGPVVQGDRRGGADIAVMAGMINGVDFDTIARRYLDQANQADLTQSLSSQSGKVVKTYHAELEVWLKARFGFDGKGADALAYFNALAPEQQRVFLRSVYYSELREGGREFNDPNSLRFGSFLRSRNMIATLFPDNAADGGVIGRPGDITLFGNAGVHTDFGGDIQMMAPGGQIVVGVQGAIPASTAGVMTQGAGNIQLFSEQSLLLGLSRIMTTFGGDIFAWSEEGDINAGRGSKTTQVYTPPKRVYDQWGNVTLSPQVPSSGAGIATLSPIPEAAAGDVDLVAPLGTIDAGEAGIRVSGNVNIAALQVVNAANIQVQGKSAGLPVVAAVNVGALTNASAAASSAAMAAQDAVSRDRAAARQNLPSVFTVRVLGFGSEGGQAPADDAKRGAYNSSSPVQVLGQGSIPTRQQALLTDEEKQLLKR